MDNKRYMLEEKIKFFDALEKKGTVASAARSMGIHNDDVCYRWARKKDELRAASGFPTRYLGLSNHILDAPFQRFLWKMWKLYLVPI